ncbi:site-specific tyrosine recombinase/integron integrase [Aequorivita sp. CIP111184]|uniref:site-specific tyrosine recombinase/integron integrase n=1 Tax=Aequorivita sp. CIP111184 TaxID=2211356 RepID=UPI000DBBC1DB|nr:site-specific tyrosine recombinase/integron integrase [Aequorivita sp. CIP111184]SRX54156.1 Tyrosine recombinase XerD [Aequorivita sp. CIP111184]
MTTIKLQPFIHNLKKCLGLKFPYHFESKEIVKRMDGVRWSRTHGCFYIIYDELTIDSFKKELVAKGFKIDDNTPKNVAQNKKSVKTKLMPLIPEKVKIYKSFIDSLNGKRMSESTVKTYSGFVRQFLQFSETKPAELLDATDVRLYIEWAVGTLNYSVSTHRQMVSGLRHFAYLYPACAINPEAIFMPSKDKKLPVILSIEEIVNLIQATKNLKHRVIISMLYASGLRIGELLNLELKDFDFIRNQLHIRGGKGRKDRYTNIAQTLHPMLKNYYKTYKPKVYFIENPNGGQYSPASVRSFLKRSCKLAGIKKAITPHSLRHCYATHLLEHGTDIRYIQELLGHSRPETTMIYTQVTKKELRQIKSPLDFGVNKLYLPDNHDKKLGID